jgi:hypothetical protein
VVSTTSQSATGPCRVERHLALSRRREHQPGQPSQQLSSSAVCGQRGAVQAASARRDLQPGAFEVALFESLHDNHAKPSPANSRCSHTLSSSVGSSQITRRARARPAAGCFLPCVLRSFRRRRRCSVRSTLRGGTGMPTCAYVQYDYKCLCPVAVGISSGVELLLFSVPWPHSASSIASVCDSRATAVLRFHSQ